MQTTQIIGRLAAQQGGVVSRKALLAVGADPAEVEALRRRGHIDSIRRGWYRLPTAQSSVVAAVRSGGVLTCVSALEFQPQVWVPPDRSHTHLRWPRHLRSQSTHRACRGFSPLPTPVHAVDLLPIALQCAANCLPPDQLVAVLDSTLRMPLPTTVSSLRDLYVDAPRRVSRLLDYLDPAAGSGIESLTRYRLRSAGMAVRTQQFIAGIGRVDLLVGDKLIIECDSAGFHGGAQRVVDMRRDRTAVRGKYLVMRLDYSEVVHQWDSVFAEICEIVRADRHMGLTLL